MDRHVSIFDALSALSSGPTPGNAATIRDDTSVPQEIFTVVVVVALLWVIVFALGYAAEAVSWLADTLRARRENRPRG
jgi:hypothetical protein